MGKEFVEVFWLWEERKFAKTTNHLFTGKENFQRRKNNPKDMWNYVTKEKSFSWFFCMVSLILNWVSVEVLPGKILFEQVSISPILSNYKSQTKSSEKPEDFLQINLFLKANSEATASGKNSINCKHWIKFLKKLKLFNRTFIFGLFNSNYVTPKDLKIVFWFWVHFDFIT